MGYGAFLTVTNNRSHPVTLQVDNLQCMYDMSSVNNATVLPGTTWPDSRGQYIEADASGDCWNQISTFAIQVIDQSGFPSAAYFQENGDTWSLHMNTNNDRLHVTIQNSHPQAHLMLDLVEG